MAEEQKNVDVPKDIKAEETPAPTAEPAKEETPVAEEPKTEEPAAAEDKPAEDKPAEEAKPEEAAEETKPEEKKEEAKPIEEGQLGHKAQGASFPKNFIPSKEFFFFGTDAYEPKTLSGYLKNEKSVATYHANVAWASETGKGLLFIGDKKAPTGIINLSDASEPVTDGLNKFTLTSKANKHSFKAATTAERDNWVTQLKLKIAEAKELASTVTESETYKKTLESFKPAAPVKKEEKPAEAPKEEAKEGEEAPKAEEAPKEESAKEEDKAESPKPVKSKRASFFGFINKKEEPKTEEPKADEAVADKPAEEAKTDEVKADEVKADEVKADEPKAEDKPAEEAKPESPKDKASKRNSFFGGILSKKEKKVPEAKPAENTEAPKEGEAAADAAPVIPPVEGTTPLADEVNDSTAAPAESAEAPAATNGETKKDVKEKRKSSLPFGIGKREKSPAPAEGEEKSPKSAFSKLRATIKGKSSPKAEDKPAEEATKEEAKEGEAAEEPKAEDKKDEPAAEATKEEPAKEEAAKPAETEAESKPENVATTTPAVTAAA